MMENWKVQSVVLQLLLLLPAIHCWGLDGHYIVCRIAQARLSETAATAVKNLLSESEETELGSVCIWADRVKFRYHWSSALHYVDTPDSLCTYQNKRDCMDAERSKGRCVAGALNNYTSQLLTYNPTSSPTNDQFNLTEALLFVSHFMGDIHQPLHVGFTSDRGGNTIDVHWYTRKQNLHHTEWKDRVQDWETCSLDKPICPDIYATEGIKAACEWAYKDVSEGSVLEDDYFLSRLPIIHLRLAQGGIRLAAALNRIFG